MDVCKCLKVSFETIKTAVEQYGSDLDTISEKTGAGSLCHCCLHETCGKVELPLPLAINKALNA